MLPENNNEGNRLNNSIEENENLKLVKNQKM